MTAPRDKIGVNVPTDTTGSMRYSSKAIDALRHIGAPFVRMTSPLVQASDSWTKIVKPLSDAGFHVIWSYRKGAAYTDVVANLLKFEKLYPGRTIGVEGPNEPDLNPVTFAGKTDARLAARTDSKSAALSLTQALRNEVRAHPELNALKVFPFNDYMPSQQRAFTSMGNTHIYPAGTNLTKSLAAIQALAKASSNGKVLIGEWGYTTGPSKGFTAVSEAQQAANFAKDLPFVLGVNEIAYACPYTLVDYPSDVTEQNRFGLFRADWTPKPAADVFAGLK